MPRNGIPLQQRALTMEGPTALEYACIDTAFPVTDEQKDLLGNVLVANGIHLADHFSGISLDDLTLPQGVVLTAPLKGLLRRTFARANEGSQAASERKKGP